MPFDKEMSYEEQIKEFNRLTKLERQQPQQKQPQKFTPASNWQQPAQATPKSRANITPVTQGSSYTPRGTYFDAGLSPADRERIRNYQAAWFDAQRVGDQAAISAAHAGAQQIRAAHGYSGGVDGSEFIPLNLNPEQQQIQAQAIQSIDSIATNYRQLMSEARSMGNEGLVALAAQWDKMLLMLDGVERQITDQITNQMRGDDPAMQNALRLIREEADLMRRETLEELNARGLVQSGIYARALSDMNKNELTQVQATIASRFGDLQTQLNQAIMSMAQARIGALGMNQQATAGMLTNMQSNVLDTGLAGLNAQLAMRGQDINQDQFGRQLTQNQQQFDATMRQNMTGLNETRRQFDTNVQLDRDRMAQQSQQFYNQLNVANRQFYDELSQNRKLAYAQLASSQGAAAAAAQLERDRFDWQRTTYGTERQDALDAQERANTFTQVGNAIASGGFVENAIKRIVAGTDTIGQVQEMLQHTGYTENAKRAIMSMIMADAGVQRVTRVEGARTPVGHWTSQFGDKYTPITMP